MFKKPKKTTTTKHKNKHISNEILIISQWNKIDWRKINQKINKTGTKKKKFTSTMLKHYYVSPKKRSKSQSSETSDGSDTATSCVEHHEYLNDFVRATKKAFHTFHEITSSEPNVNILSSNATGIHGSIDDHHDNSHNSETTTPIQTPQKSYESRLTRMRLAHAFSNAVTYSRSRLSHLPTGTSFCATHM